MLVQSLVSRQSLALYTAADLRRGEFKTSIITIITQGLREVMGVREVVIFRVIICDPKVLLHGPAGVMQHRQHTKGGGLTATQALRD
jgi:hypothetical protein